MELIFTGKNVTRTEEDQDMVIMTGNTNCVSSTRDYGTEPDVIALPKDHIVKLVIAYYKFMWCINHIYLKYYQSFPYTTPGVLFRKSMLVDRDFLNSAPELHLKIPVLLYWLPEFPLLSVPSNICCVIKATYAVSEEIYQGSTKS